jgi:hypothetical protein
MGRCSVCINLLTPDSNCFPVYIFRSESCTHNAFQMVVWLSRFPIHGQVVRPVRHRFRGGCLNSRFSSLFNSVRARTACNLGLHDGVWTRRGTDHGEIRVVKRVSYIRHKSTRATGRNLKTSILNTNVGDVSQSLQLSLYSSTFLSAVTTLN